MNRLRRPSRQARCPFSLLLAVAAVFAPGLGAQELFHETEPNDQPADFNRVAGEVLIAGAMSGMDQDGYYWTVSDADASKLWDFRLDGIPGKLTIFDVWRLEFADNGVDVVGKEKLFGMGSRDGAQPAIQENLLFEPGEYVLGFAHGGGSGGSFRPPAASIGFGETTADGAASEDEVPGGYRARVAVGDALNVRSHNEPPATRERAYKVRPGRAFTSFIASETSWYSVGFNEDQAASLWTFRGQVPVGQLAKVFLRDPSGAALASTEVDGFGRWRLADLGVDAAEYLVEVQGEQANAIRTIETAVVGQRTDGAEVEENGSWPVANVVDIAQPITGRMGVSHDADYFRFTIDEATAEQLQDLVLTTAPEQRFTLSLLGADGRSVQGRDGQGEIRLPKLMFTPGEWGLLVNRGQEGAEYEIRMTARGPIVEGEEYEPNDEWGRAVSVPSRNRIKGRFDTESDVDYFRFVVTDEAQLWRFQAIGDGLQRIAYYDGAGGRGQEFRDTSRRLRLDNLFLMPGQHFIAVHGEAGTDYTLLARPLGPPDPDGEFEPNDEPSRAQRIDIGQRRSGLLLSTRDLDQYRFTLYDWERLRLTIEPPVDGSIQVHHYWEYPAYFARPISGVGEPLVFEGLYPPGEHLLSLAAKEVSDAEYHVSVERLDRFGCPVDCEPNADQAFASPTPPSRVLEGSTTAWTGSDTHDFYALPVLETTQELVIRPDEKYTLEVVAANEDENLVAWDEAAGVYRGTIPAGVMTYLDISGANERYRLVLEYAEGPGPLLGAAPPPVEAELLLDDDRVRAYRGYGQRLDGRLRLTNRGAKTAALELETATTDRRWVAVPARDRVEIAPGKTEEIAVEVLAPRDAWAHRVVRISARAFDRGGSVSASADIDVDALAPAAAPYRHYPLPEALRGGFNVAAQRLGGRWAGPEPTTAFNRVEGAIDGIAVAGSAFWLRGGHEVDLVYELAGDEPIPLAGFTLDLNTGQRKQEYLRIADVAVSTDAADWTPVLFAPVDPVNGEQAWVLDEPVAARYVRLSPEFTWKGQPRTGQQVGEFKAISVPGYDASGGRGFNIAGRELGGHIVWHRPHIDAGWGNAILDEAGVDRGMRIKLGESLSWVVGFHHDRAALLDRFEWTHNLERTDWARFDSVRVFASMDSPLGPWEQVAEWSLSPDGALDVLELETPRWARYVKFTTNPVDEWIGHALPRPLRIWEMPSGDEYRSVLTEWGDLSRDAFWESTQPVALEPPFVRAVHDAKERAAPLAPGQEASGAVLLAEHEHWYRLEVPQASNTLVVTLRASPTVRTVVEAQSEAGDRFVLRRSSESSPERHIFEGQVDPGTPVYLNVKEPPRSVVFAWDTSPSVGPYIPVIYQALLEYASQVRPGLDAVNFMPFGRGLLLKEWFTEPFVLQTVVNEYPRRESSSLAERTLAESSRVLAPRPGSKAVLLISDAFTPRYRGGLWDALEQARPRVFGLGVNIVAAGGNVGDVNHAYDLFQGWAAVNGGHFSQLLSQGELEVAFDRAQTLLREPAPYTLTVDAEFREAPGPGTLTVLPGEAGAAAGAAGGAVELILDASGSMLQRIGGKRRIAIAKEVLTEAVNDWIPDGTPVALRVFGHREPNACRTDLEVPLAPLDRAAVAEKITGVNAMNLARTPIADSLKAAAGDLSGATGSVSLLLLTDGEETCEGDPAEAVAELQEQGIDVTLNIVGFAIDDAATEAQFAEWAKAGGGRYFAATDQAGLAESVNEALKVPFTVYDQGGARVAQGLVGGEPVSLEAGYYRVVVSGAERRVFDDVEIPGETEVSLELD